MQFHHDKKSMKHLMWDINKRLILIPVIKYGNWASRNKLNCFFTKLTISIISSSVTVYFSELGLFKEIKVYEMKILNTTECDNFNDYESFEYNEKLWTRLINSTKEKKKELNLSKIFYSDFETDTPNETYINCKKYLNTTIWIF